MINWGTTNDNSVCDVVGMIQVDFDGHLVVGEVTSIDLEISSGVEEDAIASISVGLVIQEDSCFSRAIAGLRVGVKTLEAVRVGDVVPEFLERQFVGFHLRM